jgi:hypothetical protein
MLSSAILIPFFLFAQGSSTSTPASTPLQAPAVSTPTYPNPSCPIMGKPVSVRLFAETEMGRIFVCCKSCIQDTLADVPLAYRTAYPVETKIENAICPVSGGRIEKDSPTVVLQGYSFSVRGAEEAKQARANSQIVLAKLMDKKLVDLENETCPVTGESTARNTFVVIEGTIVRLSYSRLVEEISKRPKEVLMKAQAIRAAELERKSARPEGGTKAR